MKHPIFVCAVLLAATAAFSQSDPYSGTSNPPPDDSITTQDTAPKAKPSPAHPFPSQAQDNAPAGETQQDMDNAMPEPTAPDSASDSATSAPLSASIPDPNATPSPVPPTSIQSAPGQAEDSVVAEPELNVRPYGNDPDGDIVHPVPTPGELGEGVTIRARLLDQLSTSQSHSGDPFRATVASDVLQGDQILIPTGSEIDGVVALASTGHTGGHGTLLLRPQSVVLANGQRYKLYAQVTGAPGSGTHVTGEGVINATASARKNEVEYGGGVGTGVITGAVLGGPVGALAGGMVGAGVITVHLLTSHPQATLDPGTVMLFSLTEPLDLVATAPSAGN